MPEDEHTFSRRDIAALLLAGIYAKSYGDPGHKADLANEALTQADWLIRVDIDKPYRTID